MAILWVIINICVLSIWSLVWGYLVHTDRPRSFDKWFFGSVIALGIFFFSSFVIMFSFDMGYI